MNTVIIGCGFAADLYMGSLPNHPNMRIVGVFDINPERLTQFSNHHGLKAYGSLDEALTDATVELVLNLTNPASHFEITLRALEAGKHVYSEKPLATELENAQKLVATAETKGLSLACAPTTLLGESAQTMWCALRDGLVGTPRLVFAELSDGPITLLSPETWVSPSGASWPWKNEFETGCTLEHAAYCVSWLTAFFGPVAKVSATAHTLMPDKGPIVEKAAPDFTCSVLEFASGVIARATCDIFSPRDRRIRIFGDLGVLSVGDCWNMMSPITFSSRAPEEIKMYRLIAEQVNPGRWPWLRPKELLFARKPKFQFEGGGLTGRAPLDFFRGPTELAESISEQRTCRLNARNALHILEVVLAMAGAPGAPRQTAISSPYLPIEPMPWAL